MILRCIKLISLFFIILGISSICSAFVEIRMKSRFIPFTRSAFSNSARNLVLINYVALVPNSFTATFTRLMHSPGSSDDGVSADEDKEYNFYNTI